MQIILIVTMAATIWTMPFMDYWDNVISIVSMGGRPLHHLDHALQGLLGQCHLHCVHGW